MLVMQKSSSKVGFLLFFSVLNITSYYVRQRCILFNISDYFEKIKKSFVILIFKKKTWKHFQRTTLFLSLVPINTSIIVHFSILWNVKGNY